ncbi:type I toxin-antitoxin system Ibs family toxin [Kluyvera cryocrescens]
MNRVIILVILLVISLPAY